MKSIAYTVRRAQATRAAQIAMQADWIWEGKEATAWGADLAAIATKRSAEAATRAAVQNAAAIWDSTLKQIFDITRHTASIAKTRFRKDPVKRSLFKNIKPSDDSRTVIAKQAVALREAWEKADPAWVPMPGTTLGALKTLLTDSAAEETEHASKLALWRQAAEELNSAAEVLDDECVAWYAVATRLYPAGTPHGNMIRSTIPTSSEVAEPVGRALIMNLVVQGDTIHFDCDAPHATHYTYLQCKPGESMFTVIAANTDETSVTLAGQPPGQHRFKAVGGNSHGLGPESAEAVVLLAARSAA